MRSMVIALCLFVFAQRSEAVTVQVPIDYPTIQQALDVATNGDVVLVGPGTYHEHLQLGLGQAGPESARLVEERRGRSLRSQMACHVPAVAEKSDGERKRLSSSVKQNSRAGSRSVARAPNDVDLTAGPATKRDLY